VKKKLSRKDPSQKILLNAELNAEYKKEFADSERQILDQLFACSDAVQSDFLNNSIYRHSSFIKQIFTFLLLLKNAGITEENYPEIRNKEGVEFLGFFFDLLKELMEYKQTAAIRFEKMVLCLTQNKKYTGEITTDDFDFTMVSSAFADYHLIRKLKLILSKSNSEFAKKFNSLLKELKVNLSNSISLYDYKDSDLLDANFFSRGRTSNHAGFTITGDILESLNKPKKIIDILNSVIFENSLSREVLVDILRYIESIEADYNDTLIFQQLRHVFSEKLKISMRAKRLIMHNLFLIYEHNMSVANPDYKIFYKENLHKSRIRLIEHLIPDLR